MLRFIFVLAFLLGSTLGCTSSKEAKTSGKLIASDFDYEKTKQKYIANCSTCHGVEGRGDGVAAKAMKQKPRNFVLGDFKYGGTKEEIFATITKGIDGTPMPPWDTLPEQDRRDLAQFVLLFVQKR